MKCLTAIAAIMLCSFFAHGQPSIFEKGYFIDTSGGKTDCFIKLEDWNAQRGIHYRVNKKDSARIKEINWIKEFGVKDKLKYIKVKANIDISGDAEDLLSYEQNPEWHEEELFLRVLVEGKINLYAFEVKGSKRYFFNENGTPVEQLVFKKYRTAAGVRNNLTYQKTLFNQFNCMDSTEQYFKTIKYSAGDLTKAFEIINACEGSASIIYESPIESAVAESNDIHVTEVTKRVGLVDTQEKEKSTAKANHYLGIVANQLLRQLFNFGGTDNFFNAPYLLQYAINSKKAGKGVNIGLTYNRNSFTDNSNGITRKTNSRNISFRIGYDRKNDWGKRWIGVYGFDFLLDGNKSKTESAPAGSGFTIESTSKGWGIGPRFGLLFRVSDKVLLGTDAAYYFHSANSFVTIPDQPRSTQKSNSFSLSLPVALFLTIKLKE
ncbi:MAG: hypothetical protein JJE09_11100 [Bacteroidia bacterium]|nr:hypothetical protein [Bacteroidia bacterium]